jgi:nucleoside 2-deoxyribosyltransferase
MPFAKEFADVYAVIRSAVTAGISGETVTCRRLDEIRGAGRISDDLVRELSEATVCIADITGCNPNVMWEVGYALALQKPTLLLTQDISHLPFDIKDMRTIAYERASLHSSLHDQLPPFATR